MKRKEKTQLHSNVISVHWQPADSFKLFEFVYISIASKREKLLVLFKFLFICIVCEREGNLSPYLYVQC